MKKYYCDVCGSAMPELYERSSGPKKSGSIFDVAEVSDMCESCKRAGQRVNIREEVMGAWRREIAVRRG